MLKKLALIMIASGCLLAAKADDVTLVSSASTSNNSGSATQVIAPNPQWAAALPGSSWISNAPTGDPSGAGYVVVPDGTAYTFTETFNLNNFNGYETGSISVLADDTTNVVINGTQIYAANLGGSYPDLLQAVPIGCAHEHGGDDRPDTLRRSVYLGRQHHLVYRLSRERCFLRSRLCRHGVHSRTRHARTAWFGSAGRFHDEAPNNLRLISSLSHDKKATPRRLLFF